MKITAEPRSDQWNADDFVGGPRVFTIAGVIVGKAEQKYDIELAGESRVWRPPLTMLRLLIAAWGDDSKLWAGRRVELYRDPSVRFGSDQVGGIRISRMSHLPDNKTYSAMLTITRGRRSKVTAEPLPDAPSLITQAEAAEFERRIADADTLEVLNAIGTDLKSRHLGAFKDGLQSAWSARSVAIKAAAAGQGGVNDQGEAAEPSSGSDRLNPPGDQPPLATDTQLAQLRNIRSMEKYDADDEWFGYLRSTFGIEASSDSEITAADAAAVIAQFQ